MSTQDAPPRPPQATAAGWTLVVGGVFVVLTAFESVSGLRSLESREQVEQLLSEPPGSGLGLGVEGVLRLMHAATLVTGACAAGVAVLGWQVLRRDKRARAGVSVLAVPLFLAGTVVGGLVPAVVAAAAALLWLQPTRSWFDGTPAPPRRGLGEPPRRRPPHPLPPQDRADRGPGDPTQSAGWGAAPPPPVSGSWPGSPAGSGAGWQPGSGSEPSGDGEAPDGPRPYDGFGSVRTAPVDPPVDQSGDRPGGQQAGQPGGDAWGPAAKPQQGWPAAQPWAGPHPGQAGVPWGRPGSPAPAPPPRRPAAVVVACVVTWVATTVVGLLMAVSLVALALAPDFVLEQAVASQRELADRGVGRDELLAAIWVVGVATVLWCVAAAVFAGLAFRGSAWGRSALLASAVVATVVALLLSVDAPALVLPMLAGSVVVACLLRPESRAFARGGRGSMAP